MKFPTGGIPREPKRLNLCDSSGDCYSQDERSTIYFFPSPG